MDTAKTVTNGKTRPCPPIVRLDCLGAMPGKESVSLLLPKHKEGELWPKLTKRSRFRFDSFLCLGLCLFTVPCHLLPSSVLSFLRPVS